MTFSHNYDCIMREILGSRYGVMQRVGGNLVHDSCYSVLVKCELAQDCTIPALALGTIETYFGGISNNEEYSVAIPLFTNSNDIHISGAESIIRTFSRFASPRLAKVVTQKGEVYYGRKGIILDKDFTPLLLCTATVHFDTMDYQIRNYTIYLHPSVFTDSTKAVNKSLAKKGIAFYSSLYNESNFDIRIVVDDCSEFVIKPTLPNINTFTDTDVQNFLKDNISIVLREITNDRFGDF